MKRKKNGSQQETKPIRDVKLYIDTHYQKTLKLDELAEMAGFNATYFSTLFKKQTGQTLTEYILKVRMEKAQEMLVQADMPISEIAEKVGVTDVKYFSKQFKKFSGLTPTQYRYKFK